jgi:tetratricopeptide (TPR) repeat protein
MVLKMGTAMVCGNRCCYSKILSLFCFLSVLLCPGIAPAQVVPTIPRPEATGQIVVRVKDSDGSPMGLQASVTLRSTSFLTNITTNTMDAAQVTFNGLHAGEYVVEVSALGYRTAEAQAIIGVNGQTENVEVVMIPELSKAEMAGVPGPPVLAPKALKETEKGLQALQAGKLEEAETHLKRALQLAPGFPDVNYLMGVLWIQRHDAGQARGYLEKTVQLAPKHAPALLALGEAEYLQKDYAHALESLEQSLDIKPTSWHAHWLAGVASYQLGDYKRAREHARGALLVGKEKAESARLLLGEAQTALGEREAAMATLEQYLREQPNAPQAATAKELIAWLKAPERQKPLATAQPVAAEVTPSVSGAHALDNTSVAALPSIAPVTETNWAPPDVDEEKPPVDVGVSCALNQVVERAGARVEELVRNVDRFTATEEMEHESLSPLGVQVARDSRRFNYLVMIRQIGGRALDVQEYRDGTVSLDIFPAHLATLGMPALALVYHPYYRDEYEFMCEGRGEWRGRPSWVVHFRQRDDRMSEMRAYRVNGMSFPVHLKGRAWIDADTSQILAMEADMVRPLPEIRLVRDHQLIEYGPVEFVRNKTTLWLPKSADWYCSLAQKRYHRRHSFSNFLLFSVDDKQWIGNPKETEQN